MVKMIKRTEWDFLGSTEYILEVNGIKVEVTHYESDGNIVITYSKTSSKKPMWYRIAGDDNNKYGKFEVTTCNLITDKERNSKVVSKEARNIICEVFDFIEELQVSESIEHITSNKLDITEDEKEAMFDRINANTKDIDIIEDKENEETKDIKTTDNIINESEEIENKSKEMEISKILDTNNTLEVTRRNALNDTILDIEDTYIFKKINDDDWQIGGNKLTREKLLKLLCTWDIKSIYGD